MLSVLSKLLGRRDYYSKSNSVSAPPAVAVLGADEDMQRIIAKAIPFTMTSNERLCAVIDAVRYVEHANIRGDIVECGVWKGGSMMAAAYALIEFQSTNLTRKLYLYDTFEGMTAPTEKDLDIDGKSAVDQLRRATTNSDGWCRSPVDEVKQNLLSTGYPEEQLHFIQGKVEDTLPGKAPANIAILRLDTDWYESTKHELVHLYPRVQRGGIIIIDDYGHWNGARTATDEFLQANKLNVFLHRIDYTARLFVKP
jgi:hypothetical protein